ncbi:MAG: hypothetical protein LBQ65_00720, partial [Tannerellaceae bacterium]|nr:hypothetical protein [Tannerellaceae bacterium]
AKGLQKAREVLSRDKLSPEEREEYDYLQDIRSHELSMMASARDEAWIEVSQKYEPLLAEKDAVISEKDAAIAEKEAALARERAEKEALAAKLATLKKRSHREQK